MTGYTALLIQAPIGLDSCEPFSDLIRLPVCAFYTMRPDGTGGGLGNTADTESALASTTLHALRDLVAMGELPEPENEIVMWASAREKLAALRAAVVKAERAIERNYEAFSAAAEEALAGSDDLAITLRAYEAALD